MNLDLYLLKNPNGVSYSFRGPKLCYRLLTLARKPCFATFASVGGRVGAIPPLAFPNEAS